VSAAATPTRIRAATPADVPLIASLILELARYERLEHQVALDEGRLHGHLFGPVPACGALIAEIGGEGVGFALFFASYSTFLTEVCLHLEDLFVRPEHRGRGIGRALLVHLAQRCVREDLARFEWAVLDWNEPALRFYRSLGAVGLKEWIPHRVTGEALRTLAQAGR
jgi:GNAT superfamily N-acetyltransferase